MKFVAPTNPPVRDDDRRKVVPIVSAPVNPFPVSAKEADDFEDATEVYGDSK